MENYFKALMAGTAKLFAPEWDEQWCEAEGDFCLVKTEVEIPQSDIAGPSGWCDVTFGQGTCTLAEVAEWVSATLHADLCMEEGVVVLLPHPTQAEALASAAGFDA